MKFFGKIIIQVFLGLALSACTGTVDDTLRPILSATDQEIDLSVETNTVFTVTYNGVDVTADSEIVSISGAEGLQGNVFTPATVGSFEFQATYNGVDSEPVIVNVTDTDIVVETKFRRHVCIMEFTGSWCINCPKG